MYRINPIKNTGCDVRSYDQCVHDVLNIRFPYLNSWILLLNLLYVHEFSSMLINKLFRIDRLGLDLKCADVFKRLFDLFDSRIRDFSIHIMCYLMKVNDVSMSFTYCLPPTAMN